VANEVNFSERTVKRLDPHDWRIEPGFVVVRDRVLMRIVAYVCNSCEFATLERPECIHDLAQCSPGQRPAYRGLPI
jgi:hypothetical protein